jgi:hypothetical protein
VQNIYFFMKLLFISMAVSLFFIIVGCREPDIYQSIVPRSQFQTNLSEDLFIKEIIADNEVKTYSQNKVSCIVNNPNSDNLTYYWSTTGGMINGQGDRIIWIAPETSGRHTLEVAISDGKHVSAIKSKIIQVTADPTNFNKPLTINEIIVTPPDGKPVTFSPLYDDIEVQPKIPARIWETVQIECVADDQDSHILNYAWTCTGGKIQDSGSRIGWTMPGVAGNYSISLKVTCDKGDSASLALQFTTDCCGR